MTEIQDKPSITVSIDGDPTIRRKVKVFGKSGFPMRGGGQRMRPRTDQPRFRGVRDPATGVMKMERIIEKPKHTKLARIIHTYYQDLKMKRARALAKQKLTNKGII